MNLKKPDKEWVLDEIERGRGLSVSQSRVYTDGKAVEIKDEPDPDSYPVVPIQFVTPIKTYIFTAASGDFSAYYGDAGDGDNIAFAAGGFTITNKASAMMEFPEFNGYSREISMLDASDIIVAGIAASNNFATTLRDYGVLAFRYTYQEYDYGNMGDVHDGEFLIRCGLTNIGNKWKLTACRFGLADVEVSTTIGIASTIELRCQYNNGTLTLSYRQTGAGAWTAITSETYILSRGYLTLASGKPSFGHADETFTVYSVVVEDYDATEGLYAFILTASWHGFEKDYIYIWRGEGYPRRKIEPKNGMVVYDISTGLLYKYTTFWAIYTHVLATDTALGSMHTITGGVLGALLRASDATHANFQRITINQPNDLGGVAGAVTDNFFSADANDLPKDSGSNSGSFISSTLSGTTKQVVTKQAAGTWAAENPQQYHKVNASTVLAMIMTEE